MPIYCNTYDIHLYQGQSFFLDLNYSNDDGDFVDLNGATYEARMQVRRSLLVHGLTGGGEKGFFAGTDKDDPGRTGTGGITLNYAGEIGAMRVEIDYITTSYIPPGRHFYDIDVKNKDTNFVDKLITGTFEVISEVTR